MTETLSIVVLAVMAYLSIYHAIKGDEHGYRRMKQVGGIVWDEKE